MLKIKSNSHTKNFDDNSILEIFDFQTFHQPYKKMKISWYHRIRLALDDIDNFSTIIKRVVGPVLLVTILANIFKVQFLGFLFFSILLFSPLIISILPYNKSLKNICKKIKNYFNGNNVMEANFYSLKQKLLSQEGKQILTLAIEHEKYGHIIKDIISNLINNNDLELLDNFLTLADIQKTLISKIQEEKENNTQNENLLDALQYCKLS